MHVQSMRLGGAVARPCGMRQFSPRHAAHACRTPCAAAAQQQRPVRVRSDVRCRSAAAEPVPAPTPLNLQTATAALSKAKAAFDKYDEDKSGTLTIEETVELLNSPDIGDIMQTLTNVKPLPRTAEDIRQAFQAADTNKDGVLTHKEFLALYLALFRQRVQSHPAVLAEALLGLLDTDRNGKIDGGELKILLAILGFPAALLLPIPKAIGVDYRSILRAWNGEKS